MNKWLSNEPKNIPDYAHTNIGVGGLVVDDKDRVLVVKEKHFFGPKQIWKFPGGYAIQGEDFGQTAVREVLEETGIECEFQSVIAFRHIHRFAFGCSDVYIVCHLKPKADSDSDGSDGNGLVVKKCAYEIDDCTWMSIPELKPQLTQFNAHILEKFLSYREMGVKIGLESIPSIIKNIDHQTYSIHKVL
ncbi:unnamed protein product [Oppiella nova]|uniref:Nudix hydrolase domain-containing protein n=1 Tax=Oppiella nova TaxID=334625 RepID=A0A7R9MIP3_9ACAR|nr:unnamed protein product [Oppiella nova]CAG2178024.1 unnamed protein product [Oppiella nova]